MLEPAAAMASNRGDLDDVMSACASGAFQLWVVVAEAGVPLAYIVTQIQEFPNGQTCAILFCAGSAMATWRHLLKQIEDWAAELGCIEMALEGRKGWGRVFPDYTESYTVFTKRLGAQYDER